MSNTNDIKIYSGTRKEFRTALILLSLGNIVAYEEGTLAVIFLVFSITFALRSLNKGDYIARRDWGRIIVTGFAWSIANEVVLNILVYRMETISKGPINIILAIALTLVLLYGWCVYFMSASLVEAAVDSNATETADLSVVSSEVSAQVGGESESLTQSIDAASRALQVSTEANGAVLAEEAATPKMTSKFCSQCGVALLPNVKFCSQCGAKIV